MDNDIPNDSQKHNIQPDNDITPQAEPQTQSKRRKRRPLWARVLKWCGLTVLTVVALILIALTIGLWILTPERLTLIVNHYASESLDAEVKAERVELTFWSTFPHLKVQVDRLEVISHSLRGLADSTRRTLPANADSLLRLEQMKGGLNLAGLTLGRIELYDLELTRPEVNLVVVNDSMSNFNIAKPSEPSADTTATVLPPIAVNRFELKGDFPIRYVSPADSIDCEVVIRSTILEGDSAPLYTISFEGATGRGLLPPSLPAIPVTLNGKVAWDQEHPSIVGLSDFTLGILPLNIHFNAQADLSQSMLLESFDMKVDRIDIGKVLPHIPEEYAGRLREIDTDLSVELSMKLLKPYELTDSGLPELEVEAELFASRVNFDQLRLSKLHAHATAIVDGANLDRSTLELHDLEVIGRAMDFKLKGSVSSPLSDPAVKGTFSGNLNFDRLPRTLLSKLPVSISGTMHGDARFDVRQSWLNAKRFHKMRVDGELSLDNFRMASDSTMSAYMRHGSLKLGTSSKVGIADRMVDSLLTASLNIDTIAFEAPGLHFAGRALRAGVGSRNVANSADTTQINPLGGRITAGLISLRADSDSISLRLADARVSGSLQRYNNEARQPKLKLAVEAGRAIYRDVDLRAMMLGAHADLELHPRQRRALSAANQVRYDSLAALYPTLSSDSLRHMALREAAKDRRRRRAAGRSKGDNATATLVDSSQTGRENIDFAIDNSLKTWLRTWQLHGSIKVERAGVFTPYFPARNRLSDVDITFSTDSVEIHGAKLRTAGSDFSLTGHVRNITGSLTSRRHTPLEIDLALESDTIDINTLSATLIRGAARTSEEGRKLMDELTNADDDSGDTDKMFDQLDAIDRAEAAAAFIVPSNIDARFSMRARNVHYTDMWLRDFRGDVSIWDGAINLDQLRAFTDIGSVSFTALYSAPTAHDINVAAGLYIKKLDLNEFLKKIPQVDSLLPMLKELRGIVDANIAITSELDSTMDLKLNTVNMAMNLSGDSLVLLDSETFRTMAKWMLFKHKDRNMIDHLNVELTVRDGYLDLYPVIFDLDRYHLGIVGGNDMALNLDYHVAVLKSPIPFKFGINIKGTPDNMKIRLGKARIDEKKAASTRNIADEARVNLLAEMRKVFRKGVRSAGARGLKATTGSAMALPSEGLDVPSDTISAADSALFIEQGLIPAPEPIAEPAESNKKKKKKK